MEITISNKQYNVEEATTKEELKTGLRNHSSLPENGGMLFYIQEKEKQQVFNMKDMKFPIDIIFINQDQEVVDVAKNCQPNQEDIINSPQNLDEDDYIAYVLEVNANSGINIGDYLDFNEDIPVMKVLFQDGSEQMALYGGERIFSRKNTKILIKKAKKAAQSLSDADYKALGKYMFKCIKIQDEREPEYVKTPQ